MVFTEIHRMHSFIPMSAQFLVNVARFMLKLQDSISKLEFGTQTELPTSQLEKSRIAQQVFEENHSSHNIKSDETIVSSPRQNIAQDSTLM